MLEWFAATTKPNMEERAERELRRQGYWAAVPKVRRRAIGRDGEPRPGYVTRPYMRGYVILQMDLEIDWWPSVNNTRGVGRLVMVGDRPGRIWAGGQDKIVGMCLSGELIEDERVMDEAVMNVGDGAVVREGPFSGHAGSISDVDLGHARIGVMLEIFGVRKRFEFPRSAVVPAITG